MANEISLVEEHIAYSDVDNPWVTVYLDVVRLSDGTLRRQNRIVEGAGFDGVVILPLSRGLLGLVKQFRYPIGRTMWEAPRGFGESGDSRDQAARELLEETGITMRPESLVPLGTIHPNSGILATSVQLFAASGGDWEQVSMVPEAEVSEVRWIPVEEVLSMIDTGEITDAFTICAVLRAQLRGLFEQAESRRTNGSA